MNELLAAWNFIWAFVTHTLWPTITDAFAHPSILEALLAFALAGVLMGGWLTHSWDHKSYIALQASYQAQDALRSSAVHQAAAKAQTTQAAISQSSGAKYEAARTRVVTRTQTILKEVPTYVTVQSDALPCNSVGLVRLLNAAAEGRDPADYQLPPGVTDDTCTAVTNAALAASVAENYGIARLNAEQLNGLEADVKARIDAANSAGADAIPEVVSPGSGRAGSSNVSDRSRFGVIQAPETGTLGAVARGASDLFIDLVLRDDVDGVFVWTLTKVRTA